ncbi:MAG: c-type cytochrome [Gallionellaceae bacterium]|jgi:cytochrome c553
MPKHIVRLLAVIAVIAIIAITARTYFKDPSFYQYGHYRGNAPAEIASKIPKLRGSDTCKTCHKAVYAEWTGGIHNKASKDGTSKTVVVKYGPNCEVCHTSAAGNHPSKEAMPLSVEDQVHSIVHPKHHTLATNVPGKKLLLSPEEARSVCLNCHEKMPGRPKEQRQIAIDSHAGVEMCVTCHNPHSPKIDFSFVPRMVAMQKVFVGNAVAGKSVSASCAGCHGATGVSVSANIPNLAGQNSGYLSSSLRAFKSKVRDNDMMSAIAAGMSEADIENVSAFYSQNSCKVTGGDRAKVAAGKAKVATAGCAACHNAGGLRGAGAPGISGSKSWPNLAGQNAEYLGATLKAFQDSTRYHTVMTSVAKTLSAADIDNLVAYYASVDCK